MEPDHEWVELAQTLLAIQQRCGELLGDLVEARERPPFADSVLAATVKAHS
jgi:hypothetical protein